MVPRYGRGPKGKRVEGSAPHGHWLTTTFMAALRHDRIDAPCVFDGPINGDCFKAWTTQQLAPTLRPGDVVIMDNLGCHKSPKVREAIEAAGARLRHLRQGARSVSGYAGDSSQPQARFLDHSG